MAALTDRGTGGRDFTHAVVRGVPSSFSRAIPPYEPRPSATSGAVIDLGVDVELARRQHDRYCEILEAVGLDVVRLAADDLHPDCCFVEDAALVVDDLAIVPVMGAPTRRGESGAVAEALGRYRALHYLRPPATLDGGDVLRIGKRIFVGRSRRTNAAAVKQLADVLRPRGYEVSAVQVHGVLHLKSAVTLLAEEQVLFRRGVVDSSPLVGLQMLAVPRDESHAANCIAIGGTVILPDRAPSTASMLRGEGFEVLEVDMSEFRKAGGLLTCCSIIFGDRDVAGASGARS